MATEDEELALLIEHREILNRFHAAKANADTDPVAWRAAKAEMREHRAFWRGVRDFVAIAPVDGDAVANPATHGMGLAAQEV